MQYKFLVKLILVNISCLYVSACSTPRQYQDNSNLEQPPQLAVNKTNYALDNSVVSIIKGLGDKVSLSENILLLKQPFNSAWDTLEQALKLNNMLITDRNREQGRYYIQYDPDEVADKAEGFLARASFFIFQDEYERLPYVLQMVKSSEGVKIKVTGVDSDESFDLLDDGEDLTYDTSKNRASEILLRNLYRTLKHELPLK